MEGRFDAFSPAAVILLRSAGKRAQFNPVAVRVLHERLQRPVRAIFAIQSDRLVGIEMAFPLIKAVNGQCKMPASVV